MWHKIHAIHHSRPPSQPTHLDPLREAERLAYQFNGRFSPALFPDVTQEIQRDLQDEPKTRIQDACLRTADTCRFFTEQELKNALTKNMTRLQGVIKSLTQCHNNLTSLLIHASSVLTISPGRRAGYHVLGIRPPFSRSQSPKILEQCAQSLSDQLAWENNGPHGTFQTQNGGLHQSLYACHPGKITTNCLVSLLETLDSSRGLIIFLDLKKAFKLARPTVIFDSPTSKGIRDHLLKWIRSFLSDR